MKLIWNVTALAISEEGLETPYCRDCKQPLNVHQPDEERPSHLLGTCDGCGSWYLIEIRQDQSKAYLHDLPNVSAIHRAERMGRKKPARKGATKPSTEKNRLVRHQGQVA
jgi:hypothetical protein